MLVPQLTELFGKDWCGRVGGNVNEGGLCPINGLLSFYMASLPDLPSVVPAAIFAPPS